MRVGITGHQKLSDPSAWNWVQKEFKFFLKQYRDSLIGISSLAIGADQCFAKTVLQLGGTLNVVVPFMGYEDVFEEQDRVEYLLLLQKATNVAVLNGDPTSEKSFLEAGKTIVNEADLLVAVWDGMPAAGVGGTADIVEYAKQKTRPVLHLNPLNQSMVRY